MPTSVPLPAIAERLRVDPWRFLDVRCALGEPHAMAWVRDAALVCAWGPPPVVHALNVEPFDTTAALLSEIRAELPARFELRGGPAVAGVLSERHHMQMLGPVARLRYTGSRGDAPGTLVPLDTSHAAAIRALADDDAPFARAWLTRGGWFGHEVGGELVAAVGPRDHGDGATLLAAPIVKRGARKTDVATRLLAAVAERLDGDVGIDVRLDRRKRLGQVEDAGFERALVWERWWAVAW